MAKYSHDLDDALVKRVKNLSAEYGLKEWGVNVDAIRLNKSKGTFGEVVKGNDLGNLYAGEEIIAVALYEELFDQVDEQTQDLWIETLLSQITVEEDKEGNTKVKIVKPEINIPISIYHKYGNVAAQKCELAYLTFQQLKEKADAEKEAKREAKKNKKQQAE